MHLSRKILLMLLLVVGFGSAVSVLSTAGAKAPLWQDASEPLSRNAGQRIIVPNAYRLVKADLAQLEDLLLNGPTSRTNQAGTEIDLPMPNGDSARFIFVNSPIMEPKLAAKYPELQTFVLKGVDDPTATGRADLTPAGFHAYLQTAEGEIFIDPYQTNNVTHYMSYYKSDFVKPEGRFTEFAPDRLPKNRQNLQQSLAANRSVGQTLRTYQLALSAPGEYADFICSLGGDCSNPAAKKATTMAGIVTGFNRVNQIYERELSIRFVLINNTDELVFIDKDSDPYESYSYGADAYALWGQLSGVIEASDIRVQDYDLGHAIGAGGGGGIASPFDCNATDHEGKSAAASSIPSPIGDPFWVDYVSHEIGHQFTASHTYNASAGGSCSQRFDTAAFEPGSGTTIMSYAGICDGQNVQEQADAMFNAGSFNEIVTFVTSGAGSSCADESATGNTPPTVDAGADYTIPRDTPFELSATITDAEQNDEGLTVSWEQYTLGKAWTIEDVLPNTDQQDNQSRPIVRVMPPTADNSRLIPNLSSILDGTYANLGEELPTIDQTLTFRATGRDNAINGGGVASDDMQLTVANSAGPFRITSQTLSAFYFLGTDITVTWDVANTTEPPINCSLVDVFMSADNGQSWTIPLAENTPNDGSEPVTLPNEPINQGRIRVACTDNIFFDITNGMLVTTTDFSSIYLPIANN